MSVSDINSNEKKRTANGGGVKDAYKVIEYN